MRRSSHFEGAIISVNYAIPLEDRCTIGFTWAWNGVTTELAFADST